MDGRGDGNDGMEIGRDASREREREREGTRKGTAGRNEDDDDEGHESDVDGWGRSGEPGEPVGRNGDDEGVARGWVVR